MPLRPLQTKLLTALIATTIMMPVASHATAQSAPAAPVAAAPAAPTSTTAIVSEADKSAAATQAAAETQRKLNDIHERFKRCAGMQELSIRLSCYDDHAIELGYITQERAKADVKKLAKVGVWQITATNDGHNPTQTTLRSDALNRITRDGIERQPSLIIRCTPGQTEAMIDWKSPVAPNIRGQSKPPPVLVNYSADNGTVVSEHWEASTDKMALFAPDAILFGRSLMNRKSLSFSYGSVGNTTSNIARFNIEGLETALDEIVKGCYNNPPQ